jgi:hypothetical protein
MKNPLVTVLVLAVAAVLSPPARAWERVTVVVQEASGETVSIQGTRLQYGYYRREFTPKGVKDRLRVEKELPFADRDIKLADIESIEFTLEDDARTGKQVPTMMRIAHRPGGGESKTVERAVADLRGFGNPKPVLLILHTDEGKQELDITPPYDDAALEGYRPILKVLFE